MPHDKTTKFLANSSQSESASHLTDEDAISRCNAAREFALSGNYGSARSALEGLWQIVGQRPHLEGLSRRAQGEVLLRSGALTGWIGSSQQLDGAQESAKDLISESLSIFSELGD